MAKTTERILAHPLPELVGYNEIAEKLGVNRTTVDTWRRRGDALRGGAMPDPILTITGTPIWLWADIEAWALEGGRLK